MVMTLLDHWKLPTEDQAALFSHLRLTDVHCNVVPNTVSMGASQDLFDDLSNPRYHCQLSYRLESHRIVIEKQPGVAWMEIATYAL